MLCNQAFPDDSLSDPAKFAVPVKFEFPPGLPFVAADRHLNVEDISR
jgi:hypothetical protein